MTERTIVCNRVQRFSEHFSHKICFAHNPEILTMVPNQQRANLPARICFAASTTEASGRIVWTTGCIITASGLWIPLDLVTGTSPAKLERGFYSPDFQRVNEAILR